MYIQHYKVGDKTYFSDIDTHLNQNKSKVNEILIIFTCIGYVL